MNTTVNIFLLGITMAAVWGLWLCFWEFMEDRKHIRRSESAVKSAAAYENWGRITEEILEARAETKRRLKARFPDRCERGIEEVASWPVCESELRLGSTCKKSATIVIGTSLGKNTSILRSGAGNDR